MLPAASGARATSGAARTSRSDAYLFYVLPLGFSPRRETVPTSTESKIRLEKSPNYKSKTAIRQLAVYYSKVTIHTPSKDV